MKVTLGCIKATDSSSELNGPQYAGAATKEQLDLRHMGDANWRIFTRVFAFIDEEQ